MYKTEFIMISIHAPAKGATKEIADRDKQLQISIHAPAKGATLQQFLMQFIILWISIHAPAKGATKSAGKQL